MASFETPVWSQEHIFKIGTADFKSCHSSSIVELQNGTLLSVYFGGSKESADDVEVRLSRKEPGKAWSADLVLGICGVGQFSYPSVIQSRDGLIHVVHTWHRDTIAHIVVDPSKITEANTVPMPNGEWSKSGPLSKEKNKDKED